MWVPHEHSSSKKTTRICWTDYLTHTHHTLWNMSQEGSECCPVQLHPVYPVTPIIPALPYGLPLEENTSVRYVRLYGYIRLL